MKNIAIIVGAGSGERFGSYKQVEMINNKPVYKYSIDAFLDSNCFSPVSYTHLTLPTIAGV